MHDPKIVEAMARAIEPLAFNAVLRVQNKDWFPGTIPLSEEQAASALTALCALRPDVAAVLRGEAVALPKAPTDAQWDHIAAVLDAHPTSLLMERQRRWWPDLVAASPYAKETLDAR